MWYRWQNALIVDDKVEDDDSCTAINIENKFVGYRFSNMRN